MGEGGAGDVDGPRVDAGGEDDADAIGEYVGVVLAQLAAEVEVDAEPQQLGLEVGDRRPVVLLSGDQPRPAELAAELLARLVEVNVAAESGQDARRLQPRRPPTDHHVPNTVLMPINGGEVDLVAGP